ncbi:MAG: hypothetical protein RLZ98_1673 [Pseudomonadota bacterium]
MQRLSGLASKSACAATALMLATTNATAKTPEEFYKGRQMTMLIYSTAGGAYDTYARFLARFMGKHIPGNPNFIPQNMPGAGGLKAAEYIYKIAPKDGSLIGVVSRSLPFDPMLGQNPINIDPLKYVWLGSMNRETSVAVSWHTNPVKTLAELQKTELLLPGTGAGADSEIMPFAFNQLAGTKFKVISGYRGLGRAAMAMETGEIGGIGYWSWSAVKQKQDWLRDKKLNILFHTGKTEHPELKDVPLIRNAVKNDTDRKALDFLLYREVLGRPFVAPPGLPADRIQILRSAFMNTLKDPEFLKAADKIKLEIQPVPAEEIEAVIKEAAASPPDVIARVKQAIGRK